VELEQALCSSHAPRGSGHQERTRRGKRPASVVQSKEVKGGVCMRLGQADISPKVAQKASKRGHAGRINRAPTARHTAQVMAAFPFRGADDEDGFPRYRPLNPLREWAEGNDLEGRHAPKTASGFLNTLRKVRDAASKGLMLDDSR